MELFKLLGTIAIENSDAIKAVDNAVNEAEKAGREMSTAFKKVGSAVEEGFDTEKINKASESIEDAASKAEQSENKMTDAFDKVRDAIKEDFVTDDIDEAQKSIDDTADKSESLANKITEAFKKIGKKTIDVAKSFEELTNTAKDQEAKLADLKSKYQELCISQGKNSKEAKDCANEIRKLSSELADNKNALKDAEDAADRFDKTLKDTAEDAGSFKDKLSNAFKSITTAGAAIGGSLVAAVEGTREYRVSMGKLETAFTTSGHSAETAKGVYNELNSVLGDSDVAVEAANHLAKLTDNQKDLNTWTNICTGVFATFGDSLPIEGLTEASNETAKTGQLTGVLCDALNWAGVYEDDFQAKLDKCTNEQERQKLITETLNGLYEESAENYRANNEELIEAEKANGRLKDAMAELGAAGEPVLTAIKNGIADIAEKAVPKISDIIDKLKELKQWFDEHETVVTVLAAAIVALTSAVVAYKTAMGIASLIQSVSKAMEGMTLAQAALNAVMSLNPIGLVIAAITALVAAFVILWNKSDAFRNFWISAWNKIKSVVTSAASTIKSKVTALGNAIVNAFKSLPSKMASIGKNIVQGLWNGISNAKSWILSKIKGFGESILSGIKGFFGIHSPSTVMRDEVGKQLALGVAEGISKNKDYAKKSATDLAKVILDAATKKLDTFKTYNDMTLAEEAAFWDNIRKQIASGTDERLTADKNYLSAKKSLDEKLQAAEDEYQKKIDETNQKIEDRAKNILNSFKLFDEFDQGEDVQGSTLIKSLETQVDALEKWHEQIGVLKEKLGDTDLFESIQEMGVLSLKQVEALNNMSEEQLEAYAEMYDKRQQLAKEQAQDELADENAKTIAEAYQTWVDTCSDLGVTVKDTNTEMEKSVETSMKNIVDNVSKKMEATAQAVKTGIETIKDAFNSLSTLNISMPDISATGAAELRNEGKDKKLTAFSIKPNNSKAETGTSSDTVNNIAAAVSNSNKSIVSDILNGLAGLGVGAAKIPEKIVTQVQLDKKTIAEATYDYTAQRGSKLVGV